MDGKNYRKRPTIQRMDNGTENGSGNGSQPMIRGDEILQSYRTPTKIPVSYESGEYGVVMK